MGILQRIADLLVEQGVGDIALPRDRFKRPADTTAYASGDIVSTTTTASGPPPLVFEAARVPGGRGMIRRFRLETNNATVTNGSFRLHLYSAPPRATNGDNGAWLTTKAGYLGSLDVTLKGFSDGGYGDGSPGVGTEVAFRCADGAKRIYGFLEARGAYTPISEEIFQVELEVFQMR